MVSRQFEDLVADAGEALVLDAVTQAAGCISVLKPFDDSALCDVVELKFVLPMDPTAVHLVRIQCELRDVWLPVMRMGDKEDYKRPVGSISVDLRKDKTLGWVLRFLLWTPPLSKFVSAQMKN